MVRRRVMSRMCAMIVIAMLAAGAGQLNNTAFAEDTAITGRTALTQAVHLYEKMQNCEVEIPSEMETDGTDKDILKAAVLGYVNLDEIENVSEEGIRKQDMMNILYKTVISTDESFAVTAEEADIILNSCYDNAYIDDENRIAYAFMMKHGIITDKIGSEPDKKITEESCAFLTNIICDYFSKKVTVNNGECDITVGNNINTVIDVIGEPNRIDVSEYGFDWYVYNGNYDKFVMIGVQADRICAVYTNNPNFTVGKIKSGDEFAKTLLYEKDENILYYTDADGRIDAVLYNDRMKGSDNTDELTKAKSDEFIDLLNSYRSKKSKPIYMQNDGLNELSGAILSEFENGASVDEGASIYRSYSVFNMYNEYLNDGSRFLDNDNKYPSNVGVSAYIDDKDRLVMSLIDDNGSVAKLRDVNTVSINRELPRLNEVNEVTTPVLEAPATDNIYNDGDDVVIKLAMQAATQYHIEVFDVESDDYVVNEYITTDATEIILPAELFTNGYDYRMVVSSITPDGISLPSEEVFISYGSVFDDGVKILTPYDGEDTDDDYLAVSWESAGYHDFRLEMYDTEGRLVTSKVLEDQNEAVIQGVDPGEYYIYVTALRRGTEVEKSQDSIYCRVAMAEPVIEEIILDRDDKYYFVYENKDLGVLYLYDEELVDVKEKGSDGKNHTVTKKKIIKKQVKATKAYKELAQTQIKREYTTGEPVLVPTTVTASSKTGQQIVNTAAKYLGVPYVWGGTTHNGFDCSGLVQYVMNSMGINVSRTSQQQIKNGVPVSKGDLQPGDLVFFESNGDVHHVGIYVGNGMMIHAPRTGDVVKYQSIETPYYQSQYAGARRVY